MTRLQRKLNLGCGPFYKEGFVNVDIDPKVRPDIVHDLDSFPYPFEENSFSLIELDHCLEHLSNPFQVMSELYRVACDEAQIIVRVPHFSRALTHPDHKRGFDVSFPLYFKPEFSSFMGTPLIGTQVVLRWLAQPYLKRRNLPWFLYYLGKAIDFPLSFLANLSPLVCSKLWCFWVGGFDEVKFVFTVSKRIHVN